MNKKSLTQQRNEDKKEVRKTIKKSTMSSGPINPNENPDNLKSKPTRSGAIVSKPQNQVKSSAKVKHHEIPQNAAGSSEKSIPKKVGNEKHISFLRKEKIFGINNSIKTDMEKSQHEILKSDKYNFDDINFEEQEKLNTTFIVYVYILLIVEDNKKR